MIYAKIASMKVTLLQPKHLSYKAHRKQVLTQVILPVILATLLMLGMIVLISFATFRDGGDVSRWAAISTIWIILPIMAAGLLFFALLLGLVFVLARILQILPVYTGKAQDLAYKGRTYIIRAADLTVRPIIFFNGLIANVKAFFGRK